MSKLLAYTIGGQKIGVDITSWNDIILSGNSAFITIADTGSTPSNYSNISSVVNWNKFGEPAGLTAAQVKTEIIKLIPNEPTPEQFVILENYATVGLNSMTNVDGNLILSSTSTPNTLTGVTDTKMATTGSTSANLEVESISGTTGTFWGDYRIEGKLWVETIRRVKQIANMMYVRVDQDLPVSGANGLAGLVILNPTGVTTGYTSIEKIPAYYLGINSSGVLVAGWSGNTLPVMRGSATITTYDVKATGNITTTSTSDTLMTGMQLTNVPAGKYLLGFGTSLSISATGTINTSIYAGGTIVANSTFPFSRGTQAVIAQHGYSNFVLTLASTQTVEIRWRTSTGTATANTNRYLTLLKVL